MRWWPPNLMDEARREGNEYFDRNIRPLPKTENGEINEWAPGFDGNDVDAFRHAYVSGVFAQEYGDEIATMLGWMNEWSSFASPTGSTNMDLWNNAVGRRLGLKSSARKGLAVKVKEALENGELIVDESDGRKYEGAGTVRPSKEKSVIVLREDKNGVNEHFFDLETSMVLSRDRFVSLIEAGNYAGYGIRIVDGIKYPFSKPDGDPNNNLG